MKHFKKNVYYKAQVQNVPWPELSFCPWPWPLLLRRNPAPVTTVAPHEEGALKNKLQNRLSVFTDGDRLQTRMTCYGVIKKKTAKLPLALSSFLCACRRLRFWLFSFTVNYNNKNLRFRIYNQEIIEFQTNNQVGFYRGILFLPVALQS